MRWQVRGKKARGRAFASLKRECFEVLIALASNAVLMSA
jgi:hypothetical protein